MRPTTRPGAVKAAILAVGLLAGSALTGSASPAPTSTFVPITPCRLLDTRPDTQVGTRSTPLAAQETYATPVWGTNGACDIPATATGVSMNVAIINPTGSSFLTVYPADAANPGTANLNWVAGQAPTPNAVTAALSADGKLAFFNFAGTVDLAADIVGYYTPGGQGPQGPKGDTGPTGPTGAPGAAPPTNRMSNTQIAELAWWQDPGRTATFPVGDNPAGIGFDGTHLWVANFVADTVTKLDPATGAVLGTYATGDGPAAVAFDGTSVWIANTNADTVSKMNPTTGTRVDHPAGDGPSAITFDGTSIWVTDANAGKVWKLNPSTGAKIGEYVTGANPDAITFDGTSIWVANDFDSNVVKIDRSTGAVVATVALGSRPAGVAYDGTFIWAGRSLGGVFKIHPVDGLIATYTDSIRPTQVVYDGTWIWATSYNDQKVVKFDPGTGTKLATYATAATFGIVFDGTSIWVTEPTTDSATRLNRG